MHGSPLPPTDVRLIKGTPRPCNLKCNGRKPLFRGQFHFPMRLSLATRIFLGYAAVLLAFGTVAVFAVTEMHQNRLEVRLLVEGYLHLLQDVAAIETFERNQERDTTQLSEEDSFQTRRA